MGPEGMNSQPELLYSQAYHFKEFASKWCKYLNSSCPAKRNTFFHLQVNLLLRCLIAM